MQHEDNWLRDGGHDSSAAQGPPPLRSDWLDEASESDSARAQTLEEWRPWTPLPESGWPTWIALTLLVALVIAGIWFRDLAGLLIILGAIVVVTGVYALRRRRLTWARLGSQGARTVFVAIGSITFITGIALILLGPRTTHTVTPSTLPSVPSQTHHTPSSDEPSPAPSLLPDGGMRSPFPAVPVTADVFELLDSIDVKGRAPKTGYDRVGQFGEAWLDVDANRCDTRNDILGRDLSNVVKRDDCIVTSGTLNDPFSGEEIHFVRGADSGRVQIDHVVALMNAWETGAQQFSQEKRVLFANDPLNLLAVDGALNQQKGAADAATWLPPKKNFRCAYVARQVSVKAAYGLWMTLPEQEAVLRILRDCPGQGIIQRH